MDIKELEAKLKLVDERAAKGEVEVTLVGDTEATATLRVTVLESMRPGDPEVPGTTESPQRPGDPEVPGVTESPQKSETLLNINLGDVDVPDSYIQEKMDAVFRAPDLEGVGQLPGVKVLQRGATADWEVVEDYTYKSDEQGFSITALKGFVFDRASVPRVFWAIISKDDLSNVPPVFHDLLYRNVGVLPNSQVSPFRTFERKDADDLFLELMKKSGVTSWRARLAYQAVRRFGGQAWKAA